MDDIAHDLGISKKTLYQFFSDKTELVKKVIETTTDQSTAIMNGISADLNAIEELLEEMRILYEQIGTINPVLDYDLRKYYPEIYQNLFKNRREKMMMLLINNLEKGKREGLYREELNSELIAKISVSRIETLHSNNNLLTSREIHSPDVFREFFIYHLRGICNAKGIKYLGKKLNAITDNIIDKK